MPASLDPRPSRSRIPWVAIVVCLSLAALSADLPAVPDDGRGEGRLAALPAPSVGTLQLVRRDGRLLIRVPVSRDVKYETMALSNPDRFIVDFHDAVLATGAARRMPVGYGGVREVRTTQHIGPPPQVRVVLHLDAAIPCLVVPSRDGAGVTILTGSDRSGDLPAMADRAPVPDPRIASPAAPLTPGFWRSFIAAARGLTEATPHTAPAQAAPATARKPAALPPPTAERVDRLALAGAGIARPTGGLRLPVRLVSVAPPPGPRRNSAPVRLAAVRIPIVAAAAPPAEVPKPKKPALAAAPKPEKRKPSHALRGLEQTSADANFQLALDVTGRVDFMAHRRVNPLRYVLTLPDTALSDGCPPRLEVVHPLVDRVEASGSDGRSQVTIFLKDRAACSSYQLAKGGRIVAMVRPVPKLSPAALAAAKAAKERAARRAAAAGATAAAEAESTSPTKAAAAPEKRAVAQAPPAPKPEAQAPAKPAEQAPAREEGPPLIDVHFYNAEMAEILSALARYSNKNIVASSSVTGTLTIGLTQVTLEDALDLITKLHGLDYIMRGPNTYVVGTPEELAKIQPPEVKPPAPPRELVYSAKNVTPDDIAAYFDALKVVRETNIVKVPNTNTVIFAGIPDEETENWIKENLQRMDVPPPPVVTLHQLENVTASAAEDALARLVPDVTVTIPPPEVGARVIQISGSEAAVAQAQEALGMIDVPEEKRRLPAARVSRLVTVDYMTPADAQAALSSAFPDEVEAIAVTAAATGGVEDIGVGDVEQLGGLEAGGVVLLRGEEEAVQAAAEFIRGLDVPPVQVELRSTIAEIGLSSNTDVGFAWELPGITFRETTVVDGWRFGTFERDKMDFVSNFVASLERKRSKILASPKVVTLNKKTGNILVGSIIPYEITVPSEGTVTRSVQLQEIGLGVEFTPIVHSDDSITMYLKPRVATFTGFSPAGFPIVSTREAKTILRIHDGDTIIIGGLLQDEELVTKAGIPFVKDWPIIGELFSSRKKTRTKTEIVILAEVTILRPGSPATAEAAAGAGGPG